MGDLVQQWGLLPNKAGAFQKYVAWGTEAVFRLTAAYNTQSSAAFVPRRKSSSSRFESSLRSHVLFFQNSFMETIYSLFTGHFKIRWPGGYDPSVHVCTMYVNNTGGKYLPGVYKWSHCRPLRRGPLSHELRPVFSKLSA